MSGYNDKDKDETCRPPKYSSAPRLRLAALGGVMLPAVVLAANIVGTPEPDVLEGTPQADTINGKGGADTMMGLPGDDTYFVAQPDDEVLEAVGDGTDTIRSTINFQLPINVENLTLVGGAAYRWHRKWPRQSPDWQLGKQRTQWACRRGQDVRPCWRRHLYRRFGR